MKPKGGSRLLITIAVMSATVMQVLDTTIVNVALPQMQGSLSASADQISWVLTSYLVAAAILMPLTGYLTDTLGRRRYLLYSIGGFVVSSMLCGLSRNLAQIVTFRLLQGVFGAALAPLSQAIMADTFPLEERGRAMSIWGIGVMIGPILGPTLGGYLTDTFNWRWTFFINLPVGVLSLLLALYVPDTPRRARDMDWVGFGLLAIGIGGLQFMLDRGNIDDWFNSSVITFVTLASVCGIAGFALRSLLVRGKPLFDLRIFRDANFTTSSLMVTAVGLAMYGAMVIQPIMLEGLFQYPTLSTGLVMAPRGIASMVSMLVVGKLVSKLDSRLLIGSGILFGATGTWVCTHYTLETSYFWFVWPVLMQGMGLGMIWVPLSTLSLSTLPPALTSEGAGFYSLLRTIGASIGVAVITTFYTRDSQSAWNALSGFFNIFNPALAPYMQALGLSKPDSSAAMLLGSELERQARMVAIIDVYWLITFSFLLMLPLVWFLKQRKGALPQATLVE
jgi:DHA2 family multidrug resistance protein